MSSGTQEQIKYPDSVGSAADLMFIVDSVAAYLADCLLLYDQIIIPASQFSITRLYGEFLPSQLDRLFEEGRIKFCPAMSWPPENELSVDSFLSILFRDIQIRDNVPIDSDIVRQIEANLMVTKDATYSNWLAIWSEAEKAFYEAAQRPKYGWLYPIDPRTGNPNRDRIVGLQTGLARMNDLIAVGILDIDIDLELAALLAVCFPTLQLKELVDSEAKQLNPTELAKTLHRIENLPPIGDLLRSRRWTVENAMDAVLSEEAHQLRNWLKLNIAPGVDVRDVYFSSLNALPSKKDWIGWTRFGVVSAVSTAVGSLLTANPFIGAAAGLAIGAADQKFGEKVTEKVTDNYHPKKWLSFVKRSTQDSLK